MREKAGNQFFSHGIHGRTRKKDERESVFLFFLPCFSVDSVAKNIFQSVPTKATSPHPTRPTNSAKPGLLYGTESSSHRRRTLSCSTGSTARTCLRPMAL